jgi:xanthine dehydrogenase YagR molybdenum-binding subunit
MNAIGQPLARPDGPIKVTGAARYAADFSRQEMLHAVLVTSPVASGRLLAVETEEAAGVPGVVRILLAEDMPRFGDVPIPLIFARPPMQDDAVRFEGQPVAIALAGTLEQAEAAARLVRVRVEAGEIRAPGQGNPRPPAADGGYAMGEADFRKGDAAAALAAAPHRLDADYAMPSRHHNPMEPHATLAWWDEGGGLTVHDATQWSAGVRNMLAMGLGVPPERVRVVCPHTGGGFGAKGYPKWNTLVAAAAARVAGRPVKLVLTRAQMYTMTGYQPHMRQRIELGADAEGRLTALRQEAVNVTSSTETFVEYATFAGRAVYAAPAIETTQRIEEITAGVPTAMRAPVEGPGMWALESAMDELAHALGMDPLELRLRNHADADPQNGKPWSSKRLREAYALGAERFGWSRRPPPGARDGDWLVGWGMATASMGCFRFPASARVTLRADGTALMEASFQDIGTGVFAIFPQIVGDALGLPPERVEVRHGDSALPETGGTYGSSTTMCVGAAALDAARQIRAELGGGDPIAALRAAGRAEASAVGRWSPGEGVMMDTDGEATPHAMRTWGAVFVEVGVDPELGLLRLRRMLGSYSVGRIINPRTARSQLIGGLIWGWGMAAMEASVFESRLGRFLSKNLSGVALPVNADITQVDAVWVEEEDPHASPIGGKGIGEIGAVGVAAAVANAVFHATGRRVRELPILPEKLVAA